MNFKQLLLAALACSPAALSADVNTPTNSCLEKLSKKSMELAVRGFYITGGLLIAGGLPYTLKILLEDSGLKVYPLELVNDLIEKTNLPFLTANIATASFTFCALSIGAFFVDRGLNAKAEDL